MRRVGEDVETAAHEIAAAAARRLLRGHTWQALAREIAWTAVRATGRDEAEIEWLTKLVEAQLAARTDRLEPDVAQGLAVSRAGYLAIRPHDEDGADKVAGLHAHDQALQRVSDDYLDVLHWAVALLRDQQAREEGRKPRLRPRRRPRELPTGRQRRKAA